MPRIVTSLHASAAAISSRARQRTALHGPADVYEEEDDERAHKEMARTARRHDGGPGDDHSRQRGRRRWPLHRRFGFRPGDRKSTRLNSSHVAISYAVFCLKKKTNDLTH